jgi:Uma2 family endonuclease
MPSALDLARLPATQDEFEAWCDRLDGSELGRFEFLYGCVVAEPTAGWPHGRLDVTLARRLMSHVDDAGLGLVFGSSQGFALPSGDTVAPDAAVVLRETWEAAPPPILGRFLTVVPDLSSRCSHHPPGAATSGRSETATTATGCASTG